MIGFSSRFRFALFPREVGASSSAGTLAVVLGVGADADLSHIPIGNCAMANELRRASDLEFGAFQPAHPELGAWLKSASAPTDSLHER